MRAQRAGSFPLRGRTPEKFAADWITEIKREMDVDGLISVIIDGKEDITEKVNKWFKFKAPLN
ncbi:hypothetical protein [Mesobacillus jeotgali]|uniref:hypothetical protein n=1 Tax=Mesobacillus jeotgali TaxID=129985 RepID=UPI001CFD81E8|nr:hypothetical protein [Mesobacillus jeotgali]